MSIRAVTFDVGSTLLFPRPSVAETFVECAARNGVSVPLELAESHIDDCWDLYFREYERDGDFWCSHEGCKWIWCQQYELLADLCGVGQAKAAVVEATYQAFLRGHHWGVYADVLPTLEALRERGIRMAVVSNWDADLLNILDDLGLSVFFEAVFPSGLVGLRKPNPAFFRHALERLELAPEEVLHVGDMDDADGDGPRALGVHPLIIDRHGGDHAHYLPVVGSLTEIVDYLG